MGRLNGYTEASLEPDTERRWDRLIRDSRRNHTEACPYCGQTLPDPLPYGLKLPGIIQGRILQFVHKAGKYGIRSDYLVQKVYSIFPDGGPKNARSSMNVSVWYLNKRLKP